MAVLKSGNLLAGADGGPDNRLPFFQRIIRIFSAKHRPEKLFCSALLFPKGGNIVISAFLGMEDMYYDVLVIDKDPAVA